MTVKCTVTVIPPSPLAADDTLGKIGGMIKAYAVPVPTDSALAPLYVGADLLDAFAIHLPAGASDDLEVLARALFERQAGWIRALTWVRDAVMATVGVKSSRAIGAAAAARGSVIGYFPLLSKSAGELVVGEDDRHLDFRVAILLRTGAAGARELVQRFQSSNPIRQRVRACKTRCGQLDRD